MEQLKTTIQEIIAHKSVTDWMIIHAISKSNIEIVGVEFSFVDGKERQDDPFKTNQGYISLTTLLAVTEFGRIATELTEEFKANTLALSNLFIVITRASYSGDGKELLIKNFRTKIGKDLCKEVFDLLIISLNSEYYKDRYSIKKPLSTNEWLEVFSSTQYMRGDSDPLINCLRLVRTQRNSKIDFELLEKMKPLLRAVLVGWYGFDLKISKAKLEKLYDNPDELTFLSACLIDDSGPDKMPPDWLTETLVERFLKNHWDVIGRQIFVHTFGLSFRNKNNNKLYEKLADLSHTVLLKRIQTENSETISLINTFEFPNDFIAFFGWLSLKKIPLSKIPASNKAGITNQFVAEFQKITRSIPVHLASENSSDPFRSFQLYEPKYQTALSYVLFFLLSASDTNRKDIKNVCHEFKPLFYGGFRGSYLATHFTEIMMLIALSGNNIYGIGEEEYSSLKQYLKIISDTILIPYIHLTERKDEIWNPESEREVFQSNAGTYLVTKALSNIRQDEIGAQYESFFKVIQEVAIAEWELEINY